MIQFILVYTVLAAGFSFILAQPVAALLNTILAGLLIKTTVTFIMSWSMLLVASVVSIFFWIPAVVVILFANATGAASVKVIKD